jgi:hypothetical protein
MKGLLLSISILLSGLLIFTIQQTNFTLGYILALLLIATHFFVVALYFTRDDA